MTLVTARNQLMRTAVQIDKTSTRGRPRLMSTSSMVDAILFVCRTGCQWSMLTEVYGISYKTIYHRFSIWSKARIFEHAFYNVARAYRVQNTSNPLIADTTFVKNVCGREVLGRTHTDRGRQSTKVSLLSDSRSVPLALAFHCGNRNDCQTLHHLLSESVRRHGNLASHVDLYADKGYDSEHCRSACRAHGLNAQIPRRRTPSIWGGIRSAIEVCFGRMDQYRRIIMRYDAKICHFKSFHYLACACMMPI